MAVDGSSYTRDGWANMRIKSMLTSIQATMSSSNGENGKAKNITPGCGWYELEEDGDEWLLRDRKKKRVYHYGQTGLLLSITDQNSQTIRFEYHNDELDRIITALGYELKLTMRKGRLVQVTDGLGRTMQYRYENGLLSDVIHMDQGITHYEYDEQGYLTKKQWIRQK